MDSSLTGLKCDNPRCSYGDDTPPSEYINCINKPCPLCGENLLTQADYDAFMNFESIRNNRFVKFVERILMFLNKFIPMKKYTPTMNGSGKITFKEIPEKDQDS